MRTGMTGMWLVVARDLVLLALGTGGMIRELFFAREPNAMILGTCLLMISGTAALQGWWLLKNSTASSSGMSSTEPRSLPLPSSSSSPESS